jgi:DNA polymerase (family 10)
MAIHNDEIAAAFEEMADLLAIQAANPFRVRAYRRAAQVVRALPRELAGTRDPRELKGVPGIGPDLASKIVELCTTGQLRALQALRRRLPRGLPELLRLPGLGPVRVRALHSQLGIGSIAELERALAGGRLASIRGFGPTIEQRLRTALAARVPNAVARMPWSAASAHAEALKAYLQSRPGVLRAEIAGSYRRGRDTVGDLDLLVSTRERLDLAALLRGYEDLRDVTVAGPTKASGVLRNGLQVDVRAVPPESFGAALYYFTGSRDHNIRLRRRAQERGLRLNEYGLFRGRVRIAGATEQELLKALDLPWIEPELREERGEIEAAESGHLPTLITREDLQGDLHSHTDASDGHDALVRMAAAARAQHLKYLAITDHSKYLGIVHGLDATRLTRQIDAIDALNAQSEDLVLLKGAEVDVLEDGSLALPDAILRRLDLVVIAIHSQFNLSESRQTTRLLRALERPCVSILAHPTGRLLGERAPYALDFKRVLQAARERPCYLEIDAQPMRLDLDDVHIRAARDAGVLCSIDSDAHSSADFADLALGVQQARRGWLEAKDVLNARPLPALRKLLRQTMR